MLKYAPALAVGMFSIWIRPAHAQNEGYVLTVELTPSICAVSTEARRKRKCLEGYALTIEGLFPIGQSKQACHTNQPMNLAPVQTRVVARVMPDESARRKLWTNVGGCVGQNASQYFRMMTNLAEKLKIPPEFTDTTGMTVQHQALLGELRKLNPTMPNHAVVMNCQKEPSRGRMLLTHMQVCYHTNSRYKSCPTGLHSNCPAQFWLKDGF